MQTQRKHREFTGNIHFNLSVATPDFDLGAAKKINPYIHAPKFSIYGMNIFTPAA